MRRVTDIMVKDYVTVDIDETLERTVHLMMDNKIDCVLVMGKRRFLGLITIKDLLRMKEKYMVKDILTYPVRSINSTASIFEAQELMDTYEFQNLPVIDNGELVGLISKPELNFEIGKNVDELTGLYKKEYILYTCEKLIHSSQQFSIAFVDINNFGYIDKVYGHEMGDRILKYFASMLGEIKPQGSILCRFGGDEFVIIIPKRIDAVNQIINETLENASRLSNKYGINVTATAGISIYSPRNADTKNQKSAEEIILELLNDASLKSTKAKRKITRNK